MFLLHGGQIAGTFDSFGLGLVSGLGAQGQPVVESQAQGRQDGQQHQPHEGGAKVMKRCLAACGHAVDHFP